MPDKTRADKRAVEGEWEEVQVSKPRVMFLSHSTDLPLKRRVQLERDFVVGVHGADWSYGLVSSGWRLRGWDVVVCQTTYHALLATMVVPGTPLVVENHGDVGERNQWVARVMVRRAWALRSVSRWTAQQVEGLVKPGGAWKYHATFPAWTDEDVFWEAGRVYERSGLFHALYAGGPALGKGFKEVGKLALSYPVAQVFGLTQLELARAIAKASVVIVPSWREGLGLIALEAMMVGRPVIATDVGGLREVVRNGVTGILVKPGRVDELGYQLKRLETDKHLQAGLVASGREFVRKFWTKEKQRQGWLSLVKEALRADS